MSVADKTIAEVRSVPKAKSAKIGWIAFAIVGAILLAGAFALDGSVEVWARGASERSHRAGTLISRYMDWPFVIGLCLLSAYLLGFFMRRSAPARVAFAVALAAGVAGLSATVIRTLTGRARPSTTVPQGWYGFRHDGHWIIGQHAYASFPSGHTATVAGAAGALWRFRRRWAWIGFIATLTVGLGRILAGAHHLSDVTAAAILGFTVGYWIFEWRERRRRMGHGVP